MLNLHFKSTASPTRKFESNSSLFQRKTCPVFTKHTPLLPFCRRIPPAYKVMTTAPAANVSAAPAASAANVSAPVAASAANVSAPVAASAAYLSSAVANMY